MKNIYFILLLTFLFLTGCSTDQQSKNAEPEIEDTREKTGIASKQSEGEPILDLLEGWLGSYEQIGTLGDKIESDFNFYIYREDGKYYGYLCVNGNEAGTSCYFDERILTEIRGGQDAIQVRFLEKQRLIQGCLNEEYPDKFGMECKESKLDEAIRNYEKQDVLFTLKRDQDDYSVIEGKMPLGKNKDGVVEDFNRCSQLTMDNTCEEDKEIFQKMFREKEQISEKEPPTYSCYNHEGELILDLYLNLEQETGTGIYYGETQVTRYITQFDVDNYLCCVLQNAFAL